MREALRHGIPVVTSNKWPVAHNGVELAELAREKGVPFRAESTVMSGTPVLSTLVDGLAGTTPISLRGILNATANFILMRMEQGASYEDALTEAQDLELAERDPTADVEGYDAMAKAMILAALVFCNRGQVRDVALVLGCAIGSGQRGRSGLRERALDGHNDDRNARDLTPVADP